MKRLELLLVLSLASVRCGGAECGDGPAAFELVVAGDVDMHVDSISVLLAIDGEQWRQSFDLGDTFADGETSMYVALEPAPTADFDAALVVEGFDERGRMTARGSGRFVATPDACNRFRVTLAHARDRGGRD